MADFWSLYDAWKGPHKTCKVFKNALKICIITPMPASENIFHNGNLKKSEFSATYYDSKSLMWRSQVVS